jgi:hypothetical protein
MRMFLHPEARAFDKNKEGEARKWVAELKLPLDVKRR